MRGTYPRNVSLYDLIVFRSSRDERRCRVLFASARNSELLEPRRFATSDRTSPMRLSHRDNSRNRTSFPIINRAGSYFAKVNAFRAFCSYAIRDTYLWERVSLFDRTRNDKCTCMRHTYTPYTLRMCHRRVALCERSKRPTSQPANQLYYYAVAPYNSRGPELNVRKARRHYRANKGVPLIFRSARPRVIILANPAAGRPVRPHEDITRKHQPAETFELRNYCCRGKRRQRRRRRRESRVTKVIAPVLILAECIEGTS